MGSSPKNIVILISGTGSNMVAIANAAQKERWQDTLHARVACVISNKPTAGGLATAAGLGIATQVVDHKQFDSRDEFDAALQRAIDSYQPALVVLAGFMRILTPAFVAHYAGRLVNIHPSLLPAFTGLNTHQRAIDAGCKVAGAQAPTELAVEGKPRKDSSTCMNQVAIPPRELAHSTYRAVAGAAAGSVLCTYPTGNVKL